MGEIVEEVAITEMRMIVIHLQSCKKERHKFLFELSGPVIKNATIKGFRECSRMLYTKKNREISFTKFQKKKNSSSSSFIYERKKFSVYYYYYNYIFLYLEYSLQR